MNKRMHWTMLVVLSLFSPAVLALGLGGAVVESYLNQPLDVRVELISRSEEELQSITAGLASAQDFELLGLSLTAITVPLEFEVVTDADRPYVHITSNLKVNEPVVQVLVEVVWASGRMLREYTLFLDPPTFDSPAPPVVVKPEQVKAPPVEPAVAPVTPIQKTVEPVKEKITTPEPAVETPDSASAQTTEPEKGTETETEQETQLEPETALETEQEPEQETEPAQDQTQQQSAEEYSGDEVYGPVARGETLWGIAKDFSKGSGYSINQAMLALQRKNPEAFIKGNINSLKSGAILRLPAFSELAELTSREALLEVLRQEEEVRSGIRSVAPDFSTPTVADSGDYQASVSEAPAEPEPEIDEGYLELVPPAEGGQDSLSTQQGSEQDAAVDILQEELSRTEEELVNARQENTYLAERIKELEAAATAREEQVIAVEDSSLASMESKLAQDRAAGQPEAPLAITPGGEKQAWYAGKTPLVVLVAAFLIALIVWGLRRRGAGLLQAQMASEEQAIDDDTINITRTLDSEESKAATRVEHRLEPEPEFQSASEPEPEPEPEPEGEPEPELEPEPVQELEPEPVLEAEPLFAAELEESEQVTGLEEDEVPAVALETFGMEIEVEAEPEADFEEPEEEPVQGEDDPEIKLDLARAYLSLGDKEASKSMLDEVIKSGHKEWQRSAEG